MGLEQYILMRQSMHHHPHPHPHHIQHYLRDTNHAVSVHPMAHACLPRPPLIASLPFDSLTRFGQTALPRNRPVR